MEHFRGTVKYGSNVSYASTASTTSSHPSSVDSIAPHSFAPARAGTPVYRGGSPYDLRNTPARQARAAASTKQGEFELLELEKLGEGGFGKVLRARHAASGELVAAKVISEGTKSEATRLEVELLDRLLHPNICELRGHEARGEDYILYLELCPNGELFHRVCSSLQGHLTEDEARPYVAQLVSAVAFMHSLGVVHRDLKLENVLLDAHGRCKICDFGLAHAYAPEAAQQASADARWLYEVCGSKSYTAPEVLEGRGYDGYPIDVWSLGICIFAMLAGFFPFSEASSFDWRFERAWLAAAARCSLTHTVFGYYEQHCGFSVPAAELIDCMLSLTAHERPSAAAVLSSPWLASAPESGAHPVPAGGGVATADAILAVEELAAAYWQARTGAKGHLDAAAILAAEGLKPTAPVYRSAGRNPPPEPPPLLEPKERFYDANGSGARLIRSSERLLRETSLKLRENVGEACVIS